jgi:hypothetical protein
MRHREGWKGAFSERFGDFLYLDMSDPEIYTNDMLFQEKCLLIANYLMTLRSFKDDKLLRSTTKVRSSVYFCCWFYSFTD